MKSRSSRPSRPRLTQAPRELAGMKLSPEELETLLRRLERLREALASLEEFVVPEWEPLTNIILEGDDESWPKT